MVKRESLQPGPSFELNDIVRVTGAKYEFLIDVIDRRVHPYRIRSVAKRSGGERLLEIPRPEIMTVQSRLLTDVLTAIPPSNHAFAYVRGRSAVDCAREHLGARWLLRVDLRAFYYSITEVDVYYLLLKQFRFRELPAFQVARLLTTSVADPLDETELDLVRDRPHVSEYRSRYVAGYVPHVLGHLAHGAPTSGALSNHVARELDRRVAALASERDLVFTRYSDDIYLSARRPVRRPESSAVLSELSGIARGSGFALNAAKTRVAFEGARKLVLGIHVDGDRLRLRREYRDRIDYELHMIETHGVEAHARKRGHESPIFLLGKVSGLIAHAQNVDQEWGRVRRNRFRSLLPDGKRSEAAIHYALARRREGR